MYLGVDLFYEAIVTVQSNKGSEGVIIMCTMIAMNLFDFVKGVLVGLFIALINALNHASKGNISIDRSDHDTSSYASNIDVIARFRSPGQEFCLQKNLKHRLRVVVVSGYSFFGNTTRILSAIECIPNHLQYVIVWFKDAQVYGTPDMNIVEGIKGVMRKGSAKYCIVGVQLKEVECFDELWQAVEAVREHILTKHEAEESVDEEYGGLLSQGTTENELGSSAPNFLEYTLNAAALRQLQHSSNSHRTVEGDFEIDKWCVVIKGECSKNMDVLGKKVNVRYDGGAWLKPGLYKTIGAEIAVIAEEYPDTVDHAQMLESIKQLYK